MEHNATLGTDFKVDLGGMEEVIGIARLLARCLLSRGSVEFSEEEREVYIVDVPRGLGDC